MFDIEDATEESIVNAAVAASLTFARDVAIFANPFDYGTGTGTIAPTTKARTVSPRPSRSASIGAGITFADTDIVTLLVANPKTPGKANYDRWVRGYASGRTVAETIRLGVTRGDIRYDVAHGFVRVGPAN